MIMKFKLTNNRIHGYTQTHKHSLLMIDKVEGKTSIESKKENDTHSHTRHHHTLANKHKHTHITFLMEFKDHTTNTLTHENSLRWKNVFEKGKRYTYLQDDDDDEHTNSLPYTIF
jgi:hypothetical protein